MVFSYQPEIFFRRVFSAKGSDAPFIYIFSVSFSKGCDKIGQKEGVTMGKCLIFCAGGFEGLIEPAEGSLSLIHI